MSIFGVAITVDPFIYLAIGILLGVLIALAFLPWVNERAERRATHRIESVKPASMTEIQAGKDALRADFAVSTLRLETSISELKCKTSAHLIELAKKASVIERLAAQLNERIAQIDALEAREDTLVAREKSLFEQLRASKDETSRLTKALGDADISLINLKSERHQLESTLDERSRLIDRQHAEILALQNQFETVCRSVYELANGVRDSASRGTFESIDVRTEGPRPAAGMHQNDGARVNGNAFIGSVMLMGRSPDTVPVQAAE